MPYTRVGEWGSWQWEISLENLARTDIEEKLSLHPPPPPRAQGGIKVLSRE